MTLRLALLLLVAVALGLWAAPPPQPIPIWHADIQQLELRLDNFPDGITCHWEYAQTATGAWVYGAAFVVTAGFHRAGEKNTNASGFYRIACP